jgi:hypothetical protein
LPKHHVARSVLATRCRRTMNTCEYSLVPKQTYLSKARRNIARAKSCARARAASAGRESQISIADLNLNPASEHDSPPL